MLDTHVHVWDPSVLTYPWLDAVPELSGPRLPADIDRAGGETDRMIFVEAGGVFDRGADEVRWVASLAPEWPELAGVVAALDLRSPERVGNLDALTAAGPVVGIRHNLQGESPADFDDDLRDGLQLLAARDIPFDVCVSHSQLDAVADLVSEVPTLRFVIDHLGKPAVDDALDSDAGTRWRRAIDRIAQHPGAHVKLSGLSAEASGADSLQTHGADFVRHAYAAFGPHACMIGSDWPVSATLGAGGSMDAWLGLIREALNPTEQQWQWLADRAGSSFYGLSA